MSENENSIRSKTELILPAILAIVAFAVFANSLGGEFVYDDNRQIVRNPLIQDAALYGKALISDVWAFKGDGSIAASNYWRPTFTAWNILNFNLFGLNPFGWHLTNVLLHTLVCLLAFFLLRRWRLSAFLSFSVALVFAVHPVHTESVAWIAGSPDLLFALFLLGSFWFAENFRDRRLRLDFFLALVFYAFALGAKEAAILCFPLFFLVFRRDDAEPQTSAKDLILKTIPFAAVAVIYFFLRWEILGAISIPPEESVGLPGAIISVPSIFVFYLKQILFPVWLGANYSLRAVAEINFADFILPLLVSLAALVLFGLLARRSRAQKIGLGLFILPLLPAMNASAFVPEQIVHDRYLYFPLLGFLLLFFPFIAEFIGRFAKERSEMITLIFVLFLCLPLAFKTVDYNRVWASDLVLWKHAVTIDESSAFNWVQYGAILTEQGKNAEAIEAFNNAIDIKPGPSAYLGRARNFLAEKRFEEAIWDLQTVVEMPNEKQNVYTLYQIYEALAIAYLQKNDFARAAAVLNEARKRLPVYHAALTEKLAVVLYRQNKKQDALNELEAAQKQARSEFLPESKAVLLRLGMLYAEMGRKDEARIVLQEYLKITASIKDKNTLSERAQAANLLKIIQ